MFSFPRLNKQQYLSIAFILIPWLWAGLTIGISLIATPVKFQAETLSLSAALDVGRHTFLLFNKIEWSLLSILFILILFGKKSLFRLGFTTILFAILVMQTFWILPELTIRTDAILSGNPKPASIHHMLYGVLEITKLALVSLMSIKELCCLVKQ